MDPKYKSVAEVADELGCSPGDVSGEIYRSPLHRDACPIITGRRAIPDTYVETIRWALRKAGKLPRQGVDRGR